MNNEYKVYITRLLSPEANELLIEACDTEVFPGTEMITKQQLIEKVSDVDAVVCDYGNKIDDDILKAASPRCKTNRRVCVFSSKRKISPASTFR